MKNLLFPICLTLIAYLLPAQNAQYHSAMTKTVAALDSADTPADYQAAANTFSRIAQAEPKEWLPLYYAAFSLMNQAFPMFREDAAKAIQALDLAQATLDKAKALAPGESDLAVLQAYLYIGRVMENPMVKGAEMTPKVFGELEKAAAINPGNPRAAFLQGTYVLNMPEFYGGGAANAKPHFEKAAALFEQEKDRGLLPHWGKQANAYYLEQLGQPGKGQ